MASKSLVFLAICLAIAVSQSSATNNYNDDNQRNQNGGSNNGYSNGNSNSNDNYNSNSNSNGNRRSNSNSNGNRNGNSNGYSNSNSNGNSNSNSNGNGYGNSNSNDNNNNNGNNGNGGNSNNNNNRNAFCKALEKKSRSLDFTCTNQNGDTVSCTERIASGTRAMLKCKKNYVVQDETMIPDMTCQSGVWNRPLSAFKCISVPIAVGYNYTIGQGFYKFYKSGRKWEDAKKICENDGGHLLVIDTPEERDIANSSSCLSTNKARVVSNKSGNKTRTKSSSSSSAAVIYTASDDLITVFLGYSDIAEEGKIISVTNQPMTQGWCDAAKSEKNIAIKKKAKNCIAMRPCSMCYVEVPCNFKRSFVCEIEPTKSNETETAGSSSTTRGN